MLAPLNHSILQATLYATTLLQGRSPCCTSQEISHPITVYNVVGYPVAVHQTHTARSATSQVTSSSFIIGTR
jgi:hypothetical protein